MSRNLSKTLETILLQGWGEEIAIGTISGFLDDISPIEALNYIQGDTDLPIGDLSEYKSLSKRFNLDRILNADRILDTMGKHRPDIASIILNHPNGMAWLKRQLGLVRTQLTKSA